METDTLVLIVILQLLENIALGVTHDAEAIQPIIFILSGSVIRVGRTGHPHAWLVRVSGHLRPGGMDAHVIKPRASSIDSSGSIARAIPEIAQSKSQERSIGWHSYFLL